MKKLIATITILVSLTVPPLAIASTPVLGSPTAFRPSGVGFGKVMPRGVFLGGDPTGEVSRLSWRHWGSSTAVGFGQGWCPGKDVASGHPCLASLHVSNLGACHGRNAYRLMTFYFRPNGRWIVGARWNACTGNVAGS